MLSPPPASRTAPLLIASAAGLVALVAAGLTVVLWVQQPTIAYIDSARLMRTYEGAVAARQKIQARREEWQSNVETLKAEAEALGQSMMQGDVSRAEIEPLQDSLAAKQRQLRRYRAAAKRKTQKLRRSLMEPVYVELNAEIEQFGAQEGYNLIFGTVAGGNILYAQDATDVTDAFLRYVHAKSGAPSPTPDTTSITGVSR